MQRHADFTNISEVFILLFICHIDDHSWLEGPTACKPLQSTHIGHMQYKTLKESSCFPTSRLGLLIKTRITDKEPNYILSSLRETMIL